MTIETTHLQLLPYSPEHILAMIEGCEQFEASFGLPVDAGLREFYNSGDVSADWLASLREATVPDVWVHGFAVVDRERRLVIGALGFKGPPDEEGVVEIAYGISPAFQGRGYATEAAAAGTEFAFGKGVRRVRAHTLPTPNASTHVLRKCGFEFVGEVVEPEDGLVWRWER